MAISLDAADALESAIDRKIEQAAAKRTRAYGEVSRIEADGTVYVMLDGAETDTPIAGNAAAVKEGERVSVTVDGGEMVIDGNYSAPATDDTAAKAAQATADAAVKSADTAAAAAAQAVESAAIAGEAAAEAQSSLMSVVQGATTVEKAVSVMQTALEAVVDYDPDDDEVTEYFWHDANGAHVLGDTSGYRNDITSSGMDIKQVSTEESVAHFGVSGSRIGSETDGNYTVIDSDSFDIIHAETSGGTTTQTEMVHFGYGEGNAFGSTATAPYFSLGERTTTTTEYSSSSRYAIGQHAVYNGVEYVCVSAITTPEAWTQGHWALPIGTYSIAEGFDITASGGCSHAEGYKAAAIAHHSHAEGGNTVANGPGGSHAEGNATVASGTSSHAEGAGSVASGYESHAQNHGTIAASSYQTAIGKMNVADSSDTYALIIGNGDTTIGAETRSNALTVDWDGVATVAGGIILQDETADRNGTLPSADAWRRIVFIDKNGYQLGSLSIVQRTGGRVDLILGATNNVSGSAVSNALHLRVARNGTMSYVISDPAAFRTAVGFPKVVTASQTGLSLTANAVTQSTASFQCPSGYTAEFAIARASGVTSNVCGGCYFPTSSSVSTSVYSKNGGTATVSYSIFCMPS